MSTLLVCLLAGAAAALVVPPRAAREDLPVSAAGPGARGRGGTRPRAAPVPVAHLLPVGPAALALLVLVAVPALLLLSGTALALALIVAAAAGGAGGLVARVRARRAAQYRAGRVLDACELLAAELSAGRPPGSALERAAEEWHLLAPVATAARLGADVPDAMRGLAATPGMGALRVMAGAWQVAERSGSGLARALTQVGESIRAGQATRRLIAAELASARATAQMMAALPVLVLLMASGIGGDPWGFLMATPAGLACLGLGLALAVAGMWWIERIAAAVARE